MTTATPMPSGRTAMQRQCAIRIAAVAAVFFAVVGGVMAYHITRANLCDPLDDPALRQLKANLAKTPRSETIKADIRTADRRLRQEYFRRQQLIHTGVWLLLAGGAVLVCAAGAAAWLGRKLPMPTAAAGPDLAAARRKARWAVMVTAAALAACMLASPMLWPGGAPQSDRGVSQSPALSPSPKPGAKTAATGPAPSAAEMARQWPRFRGPGGSGVAAVANIPAEWDGPAGKNIVWKSPVPLAGHSSPIVWGSRVFVTGATKDKRELYRFAAADGKLLWQRAVTAPGDANVQVSDDTGFAAPTPATDGRYVAAIFATGHIACFDVEGNEQWSFFLGPIDSMYGYASSLEMRDGLIIVQLDHGAVADSHSRLIAFEAATGKIAWDSPRAVGSSWCSPIIIDGPAGPLVIACGDPLVIAHNLSDGAEVWHADLLSNDPAPSPVYTGELLLVVQPSHTMAAVKIDGSGDVTATHVAWKAEDAVPDICTPLSDGQCAWTLTTSGTLTCWDAADGNKIYQSELGQEFNASPSMADGKLYILSTKGTMLILAGGREFKELGRCELGEGAHASPAFAGGCIFIRGRQNLYCIGGRR